MKRFFWTILFLALSFGALFMEFTGAWDHDRNTPTWTELLVANIPEAVTLAAVSALTAWLGPHFIEAYAKQRDKVMAEPIPVPPTQEADARNRGARTFWMGLLVDVVIALVLAVGPLLVGDDFAWSRGYWLSLALIAAKTVITAIVSYFARRLVPPQFSPERMVRPVPEVAP